MSGTLLLSDLLYRKNDYNVNDIGNSSSSVSLCRSLLVGSVSVGGDQLRQKSWSSRSVSCVATCKTVRRQSWDPSVI